MSPPPEDGGPDEDPAGAIPSTALDRGLLIAFSAWMIARGVCLAFSPVLVVEAPVLLIVLSPTFTHLILTSALLPPALFVPVAFAASVLQVALGYTVGRRWGRVALLRITRRSRTLRRWRGFVDRAASLMVFLVPGPITCTTAGAVGLRRRGFYPPMLAGVALWVAGCFAAGGAFGDPIREAVDRVADNLVPLTLLALALALSGHLRRRAEPEEAPEPPGSST